MFRRVPAQMKHCPLCIQNINLNLFKVSESVHMNGHRWMVGSGGSTLNNTPGETPSERPPSQLQEIRGVPDLSHSSH